MYSLKKQFRTIILSSLLCHLTVHSHKIRLLERELVERLLTNYNADSRPVVHGNMTLDVSFLMMLQLIVDLDEKNQILMTQMLVKLEWYDTNLHWNPTNYGGLEQIVLPSRNIWLPDIYVYNNAAGGDKGFLHVNESRAIVKSSGQVIWTVPATVKSSCSIDVLYFPFDHQNCKIIFASWTYDRSQLNLVPEDEGITIESLMENSELAIKSVHVKREMMNTTYNNFKSPRIILSIHVQRKALYYAYTVIVPSILLCVFTTFSFWLPSDNAEKIEMGLTVFLFLYFLQLMIAENTPESNSTPLIGSFLTMVMTLNSLSLIIATLVMHAKKRGETMHCPEVPRWLWLLSKKVIGRITLSPYNPVTEMFFIEQEKESAEEDDIDDESLDDEIACEIERDLQQDDELQNILKRNKDLDSCFPPGDNTSIERKTHNIRSKMYKWLYVSEVMDKLLFEIYLVGTTIACLVVLVYLPQSNERNEMLHRD